METSKVKELKKWYYVSHGYDGGAFGVWADGFVLAKSERGAKRMAVNRWGGEYYRWYVENTAKCKCGELATVRDLIEFGVCGNCLTDFGDDG